MKIMYGGIFTVLEELKVENVIISKQVENSENFEKFFKVVKEKKINVIVAEKGNIIHIEKYLYFNVLWPDNNNFISENALNNNSIVCKLVYKNFSMLFTGDIEEIAEKQILENLSHKFLEADILKVAHHGSKTSSIKEVIEVVNPKIALIGVGNNNTFGHPNEEVIEQFKSLRCENF